MKKVRTGKGTGFCRAFSNEATLPPRCSASTLAALVQLHKRMGDEAMPMAAVMESVTRTFVHPLSPPESLKIFNVLKDAANFLSQSQIHRIIQTSSPCNPQQRPRVVLDGQLSKNVASAHSPSRIALAAKTCAKWAAKKSYGNNS